ncbi:MAG TPA: rod shape-determining protein MreC [Candidatus Paceibacterota bacterium]|nr:rod shape-determining protein MreC [Candidatus Paceibacterota bacterium]
MRKENILLLFLAAIVLLIIFFPSLGWRARLLLVPQSNQNIDFKNLALENESLKTEIAKLQIMRSTSSSGTSGMLQVFVYSNYPFNLKSQLLVSGGAGDGVKTGQPVFVSSPSSIPVLIGKVTEVFAKDSLVETIFDSNFQLSVKVGSAGVSSLLKGGNSPRLTLMPKDAKVNEGDAVYSSEQDYPFGMPLGLAKNISLSSGQFFEEADLETAYNPNDLQSVFIDTNYNVKSIQ